MKSRIHYQTFVISVSLGKGCYRHLKISGRKTLEELSDSILWAFDFDNDHLHAFFMNNRAWDDTACYSSPYAEDGCPTTDKHTLQSVSLKAGQKFLYIFDFGDEWHFECKVLKILDEDTKETELIKSQGQAPEQYPDYEEDDFYEEEPDSFKELTELPVPVPDSLYDTAFRFKSEKLWKKLYDNQIFAVQLSNGEIGYCTIMSALGEHLALGLYIGEKGYQTYCNIADITRDKSESDYFEYSISQNCLQCSFENKNNMSDAEISSVQAYTKAHNIHLRGANSFPCMICVKPYQIPWFIRDEKDYVLLEEALKAGIAVAEKLKSHKPEKLGFSTFLEEIPLLVPEKDGFIWKSCHVPEVVPEVFTSPVLSDELTEQVNALKKVNKLECKLIHIKKPVQDSPEEPPYFPAVLLAMETRNDRFLKNRPVKQYAGNEASVLEDFAMNLIAAKRVPKSIAVTDDRTEALLSKFCEACDIKLNRVKNFTKLRQTEENINGRESGSFGRFMQMIDTVQMLPEEALKQFPQEFRDMFIDMVKAGLFPPETVEKMKKAWNFS
ncbi:MAG: hypothetical protein IKI37_10155 [Oscillospiraceae bacterium]|nr:hypothetical protein [Oscillospiraceae bacterium]